MPAQLTATPQLRGPRGDRRLIGRDILVLSPTPTFPLDAGNRRRVFRICSELQARGARVHFVYYPFEWPDTYEPQLYLDAMARQWDSFHLLPVTRPLQSASSGVDHAIDEWWDAAGIEPTLRWLLQRGCYDAFIVNYAYLSKALELAPPRTLKILDTHDRFTGRRELLLAMGVPPEYFHTTADQERIALERADLVWAIKDEEAEFFRTLTTRQVITMPHCDPSAPMVRRSTDPADELVLGMVGARNSVNHRNAMLFIEQVLPVLRGFLAPVKIRFGGGMCGPLEAMGPVPSGIELAGRFDEPEDFYGSVDAVLVHLTHSTGLKIKAVEAFSLGLPVIAHRHAVEGIPVDHPFHLCETPLQIAECCLELAFDRSRLDELALATEVTYQRLSTLVQEALDATVERMLERPVFVVAVAPEMAVADELYAHQVHQTVDYLRYLADIVLFVDRPLAGGFTAWCETLRGRASELKIVFSPAAAAAMGLTAHRKTSSPFPVFHSVETFSSLCTRLERPQQWLLDLPQELARCELPAEAVGRGHVRLDTLRLLGHWSDADLARVLVAYPQLAAVAMFGPLVDPVIVLAPQAARLTVPFWRQQHLWSNPRTRRDGPIWIATTRATMPWAVALWSALRAIWPDAQAPSLVWPASEQALVQCDPPDAEVAQHGGADLALLKSALRSQCLPCCVVDAVGSHPLHALLYETLTRAAVPWFKAVRLCKVPGMEALQMDSGDAEPMTVADLLDRVVGVVERSRPAASVDTAYLSDAGWLSVWNAASVHNALF